MTSANSPDEAPPMKLVVLPVIGDVKAGDVVAPATAPASFPDASDVTG